MKLPTLYVWFPQHRNETSIFPLSILIFSFFLSMVILFFLCLFISSPCIFLKLFQAWFCFSFIERTKALSAFLSCTIQRPSHATYPAASLLHFSLPVLTQTQKPALCFLKGTATHGLIRLNFHGFFCKALINSWSTAPF